MPTEPTNTEDLATVTGIITGRGSTPDERARWRRDILMLLPDAPGHWETRQPEEAQAFLDLCDHLTEQAESPEEMEQLVIALVSVQQDLSWSDPLLDGVDTLTESLIDVLFEALARSFAATRDPAVATALYERIRDHCFGLDEHIIALAGPSPHITGKQIFRDFDETVCETVPVPVLHKLEDEEEFHILHQIVGYGVTDPNTFLGTLTDAERFLTETLEHYLSAGAEIPLWLWDTDVFFERFDTFRSRVPWQEIEENADRILWARIEEHLRLELGEDRERWETFHALEEGFCGTLDELVAAAKLL
jgi:hypothetical protein